jgi:hypothetical protein
MTGGTRRVVLDQISVLYCPVPYIQASFTEQLAAAWDKYSEEYQQVAHVRAQVGEGVDSGLS